MNNQQQQQEVSVTIEDEIYIRQHYIDQRLRLLKLYPTKNERHLFRTERIKEHIISIEELCK